MIEEPKFILDCMLGSLVKWLRILGFDSKYLKFTEDIHILQLAKQENRILLTKDTGFKKFKLEYSKIYILKGSNTFHQLRELEEKINLSKFIKSVFTRCLNCNEPLEIIENKEKIEFYVPPYIYHNHFKFFRCPLCKKIFWEGDHVKNMRERIKKVISPG